MDEQKIHIFDWKTSTRAPKAEWLRKRVQTQLYPLLARSAYQKQFPGQRVPSVEFTYWEASYPETPMHFSFEQAELKAAERFIGNLANEIISKPLDSFTKTSHSKSCSYCLYRTYCQRAAVNSEEFELEDDLLFTGQYLDETPEEK